MTRFSLRLLAFVTLGLSALALSARAELPIIAKARAYLGTEAALNAVKSIHYLADVVPNDPADKGGTKVEIRFQRPYQQRIDDITAQGVETTTLDGYDGWQQAKDAKDTKKQSLTLLGPAQIKRLRANTWQTLSFYRGLEREGGDVIDRGDATIEGIACRKVDFVHAPDIIFSRYFDKNTGRLVLTETESGGTIREEGEMIVDGIRFPTSYTTDSKIPGGGSQKFKVVFTSIKVNESFPAGVFATPSLLPGSQ